MNRKDYFDKFVVCVKQKILSYEMRGYSVQEFKYDPVVLPYIGANMIFILINDKERVVILFSDKFGFYHKNKHHIIQDFIELEILFYGM